MVGPAVQPGAHRPTGGRHRRRDDAAVWAIIGRAKDDIKRALAARTVSRDRLRCWPRGLGPAGYAFAIMHLLTTVFFKAGLFFGSGAVIHAMHEEQDMCWRCGLRAALLVTFCNSGLASGDYLGYRHPRAFPRCDHRAALAPAASGVARLWCCAVGVASLRST